MGFRQRAMLNKANAKAHKEEMERVASEVAKRVQVEAVSALLKDGFFASAEKVHALDIDDIVRDVLEGR